MKKQAKSLISLFFFYIPVALVQLISAKVTLRSINPWYNSLEKPSWTPPAWVFGPAWTVIYIMMAIAIWQVYQTNKKHSQSFFVYFLFFLQLFVNGLWSVLFFGLHLTGWAIIDLVILIFLIAITAVHFFKIRPIAGLMLIPYFLWCIFALSLNVAIWRLNF